MSIRISVTPQAQHWIAEDENFWFELLRKSSIKWRIFAPLAISPVHIIGQTVKSFVSDSKISDSCLLRLEHRRDLSHLQILKSALKIDLCSCLPTYKSSWRSAMELDAQGTDEAETLVRQTSDIRSVELLLHSAICFVLWFVAQLWILHTASQPIAQCWT